MKRLIAVHVRIDGTSRRRTFPMFLRRPDLAGQPFDFKNIQTDETEAFPGERWNALFCDRCARDHDYMAPCKFLGAALNGQFIPKEHVYDGAGFPFCTAFIPDSDMASHHADAMQYVIGDHAL